MARAGSMSDISCDLTRVAPSRCWIVWYVCVRACERLLSRRHSDLGISGGVLFVLCALLCVAGLDSARSGSLGGLSELGELGAVELQTSVIAAAHRVEVDESKDGFGEEVEDAVEDHFAGGGDDVTTVCEGPADRVDEPEKAEQAGRDQVGFAELVAERTGGLTAGDVEDPEDVEHGGTAEDVVSPLVGGSDEGADETGDDHEDVEEDGDEDRAQGKTGDEEDLEKKERSGDCPVDVARVPDRTGGQFPVDVFGSEVADEFDFDGRGTKIGGELSGEKGKERARKRKKKPPISVSASTT